MASGRGQAQGDRVSGRRTPMRIATVLVAAVAFSIAGAASAVAATTTATVTDPGLVAPAPATDVAPAPAPVGPAPAPAPAPVAAPVPAAPVDPVPVAVPVPAAPVDPASTTPATTTPPPAQAEPAPDQLSLALLAQANATAADSTAAPSKTTADVPPVINPARTSADTDAAHAASKPAAPPPAGDKPPVALVGVRREIPLVVALVPSLVPVVTASADPGATRPRGEAAATRASPVWNQFVWRDIGAGGGSSDLGTRALLAIIGILPFAPVDGPDRTVPPPSQLALLIPVLALVAFLFATGPIVDPRRRGPHLYRAVALKPG